MTSKLFQMATALIAAAVLTAPASARHQRAHRHAQSYLDHAAYGIDFAHNYGPGRLSGTYAYYDGPLGVRCAQSAAAYRGQDGRRHPCN